MRNCIILLFTLLVCGQFLFAELPPAFTSGGDPELYETLMDKAKDNLKKLDKSQKRGYRKLLRDQDDVLMAYLLAYESDANLCQADPADILSNYRQICLYLESYGTEHTAEFFLSYVADQTISDERVEAYRAALLDDGLREILQTSENELELYRAVSHWCVSRLKFTPTSGRDQSPLDITQKSFLGRCEEMQILFVAAARTVGLPARAASVPWWPHQDNNHAWAEVWLDGAWHYTGDMDSAYYPDQTWFSGLIDKTVLILASGSLPSENDEVLHQGKYECVINSTPNYAGEHTRNLKLKAVDARGKPVPNAELRFLVYNWNSLRSLVAVETDAEGVFEISVGRGAFYISASKDDLNALQLVPSGDQTTLEYTLVLKEGPLPDQNAMLEYPANEFEHQQAPREWKDAVAEAKALWQERDEMFRERRNAAADTLLGTLASACRGNLPALEEFLRRHPSPDEDFLRFVTSEDPQYLDPKFLWQANASQIEALYDFYRDHDWSSYSPDELSALIDPAVFYEELPQPVEYRDGIPQLYPKNFFFSGETNLEKLEKATRWLKKRYKQDAEKALTGLIPLDIAVGRKHLNSYQYRTLAVSLARANRVPAVFSRQPERIYVAHAADEWGYYDLDECAPEADAEDSAAFSELKVLASDSSGVPVSGIGASVVLCRFQDGVFYWLDQSFKEAQTGIYSIRVPRGEYYLNLGYRVSNSRTAFQLKYLNLSQREKTDLEFTLPDFPRRWDPITEEIEGLIAGVDTTGVGIILIGNHDQENSVRLVAKLRELGENFLWLGFEEPTVALDNYLVLPAWRQMVGTDERNRLRAITLLRRNDTWQVHEGLWERLPK